MAAQTTGLVGQSMGRSRPNLRIASFALQQATTQATNVSGTLTSPNFACVAEIFLWGAGGGGGNGGATAAGGGGGACYKRVRLAPNTRLPYVVGGPGTFASGGGDGQDGASTTLTLPNGIVLTAQGGKANVTTTPGQGGGAFNGDLNRRGGKGAALNGTDSVGGEYGGAGGGGTNGGGGAAGFSDLSFVDSVASTLRGGAGGAFNQSGGFPGGGSGQSASLTGGGGGQMLAIFHRLIK